MVTFKKWRVSLMCVVLMAFLVPSASGVVIIDGGEINYPVILDDSLLFLYGDVDFVDGSSIPDDAQVFPGSNATVDFLGCVFGERSYIGVTDPTVTVTFHGTGFEVNNTPLTPDMTLIAEGIVLPDGSTIGQIIQLQGYNTSNEWFKIQIEIVGHFINLVWTDSPPEPEVIAVQIDIKPDSTDNVINLGAKGVIPVAILSDSNLPDVSFIDPNSLYLGGAKVAVRGKSDKWMSRVEDVDGVGNIDLMLQFDTLNFDPNVVQEGSVYLEGALLDGTPIEGEDWIIVVPE
ncbi:MAG: hypothetical protein ACYTEU_12570 [Planctomycetota bacterium]|jgi:hypothetical protein